MTDRPGLPATGPSTSPSGTGPTTTGTTTADPSATGTADSGSPSRARPVSDHDLDLLKGGAHPLPHDVLGAHPHDGGVTVRSLHPLADSVHVVTADGTRTPLQHERHGVWVGVLPLAETPDYRLEVVYPDHPAVTVDDPYRFLPTLGEMDRHLVTEGRHEDLWKVMGARVRQYTGPMGDVTGTSFAVWAPRAQAVRLACDANHWDARRHMLRALGTTGIWEIFVPDVGAGTRYKFEILGRDGQWRQKADPMAYGTEIPPLTGSVVVESRYSWRDDAWMEERRSRDPHSGPMSVYEVHLGSWRQGLSYRELAEQLVGHVKATGFTHVELLPVMEHPFGGSWGYHLTGYFAPTSRFGHPDDFRYLVDTLHQNGIGVILDWVPGHFATDAWALVAFDGEPLYEHPDPRKGWHSEWGSYVFDFGRREVRNFLVANALYWLEEFHADGLRVDGVASMLYLDYSREPGEWVPNRYGGRENLEAVELLQEVNATAYKRVPGIVMVAEESTAWPGVTRPTHLGGLGFGLKWNMGWMHDSLGYVAEDPVHRQYHHHRMTFSLMYAFSESFLLPISHDEVVHGKGSLLRKMPGDRWQQLANLRAYLAYMWAHPGKQLLFMGSEFAQEAEWAESRSLDWWLLDQPVHVGVQRLVTDMNAVYSGTPALWELDHDPAGFEWVDANDGMHNTFSFIRRDTAGEPLVCVVNFAGAPQDNYRVGLPRGGVWDEVLNTDADAYGGSGVGNLGRVYADSNGWHGLPASVSMRVPPLGAVWLRPAAAEH